jgi:cytochrome c553
MRTQFSLLAFLLAGPVLAAPNPGADNAALVEAGRMIYEQGILPDGAPLQGIREGGTVASGRDAACVLCHQRSGMGLVEGASLVPPVTATALFGKLKLKTFGRQPRRAPGIQFKEWPFKTRPPYDDTSLAAAIRSGVSPSGHRFQYMMPRYELDERDMAALVAYLRALSARPSPGADDNEVHFATVVVPGSEPARKEAFLGVLKACFREKFPDAAAAGVQANRLHVWELVGPPASWQAQLEANYAQRPVFALVSGLGVDEWGPVEQFCEANGVPCLFPNTDVPGSPDGGRYGFYFFRGALLEADVIASYLKEKAGELGLRRVVAVSRAEGAGARAAQALAERLAGTGLGTEHRVLRGASKADALAATAGLGSADALVLLLREPDLADLAKRLPKPPGAKALVVSGLLGGQENTPLPAAWRKPMLMVYPFDPPPRWNRRMDYNLRTWLRENDIKPGDERMQGNTLAACNLLNEGMLRLRGQYLRDYLVEWTENYPTQMGNAPAPQAFPRFSLGPGQRFSSKGAYVARFAPPDFLRLERVEDWIVP